MEDSQNSTQIVGLIMVKNLTWCWTWQWGTNVKKKKERKKSCIQQLFSNEYSLSQAASNQWTCQGEIATFTFLPVFKVDGWDPFIHWPPQQHCGHTPLVSHTPAWLFQLFPPSTHTPWQGWISTPESADLSESAKTYVSKVSFAGAVVAVHGHRALRLGIRCLDGSWLCLQDGNGQELGLAVFWMLN